MSIKVGYIYSDGEIDADRPTGVQQKVLSQIACLNNNGFECDLLPVPRHTRVMRYLQMLPFFPDNADWFGIEGIEGYDVLYIRRRLYSSRTFRRFSRSALKRGCMVLLELPTYPYDAEMKELRFYPLLFKDRYNRARLKGSVTRIVDLSGAESIWGIPTIQMRNGIDLSRINTRRASRRADIVNICCVASFASWHGIDRFIDGIANYYSSGGSRNVVLHLVGDGEIEPLWHRAKERGIASSVEFYGRCTRFEMDAVFDMCTLAIESLGSHRKGCIQSSSLKSREYLAKGIPFVYSGEIDVFKDEPVDFCLKVPADESCIDIEKVLTFHDGLYKRESEEEVILRIRDYANRNVSMEKSMASVIDYIKGELR